MPDCITCVSNFFSWSYHSQCLVLIHILLLQSWLSSSEVKQTQFHEILGFCCGVVEIDITQGYDIWCVTEWLVPCVLGQHAGLIFSGWETQWKANCLWDFLPMKMRQMCCLETLGANHPVTQCHILEEWRLEWLLIVLEGDWSEDNLQA